jgi:P27 family predicted phage terminase small subunit
MPTPRKSLSDHALQNTKAQYVQPDSDVAPGRPKYPRSISGEAKAAFKRLVRLLESRRTCTAGDSEILRLYAVTFDRHSRALEHLAAEGEIAPYTRLDSNGQPHQVWKENLWLKVATDAEKFMRGCLADLGLNPLQRSKVKTTRAESKPEENEFPSRDEVAPFSYGPDIDLDSEELTKALENIV